MSDDKPIPRNEDRFSRLAHEPPAVLPDGYTAPLDFKTTTERIAEREEWLEKTEQCPHCGGHGRVMRAGDQSSQAPPSTIRSKP